MLLATLRTVQDWQRVDGLRRGHPAGRRVVFIALLPDATADAFAEALRLGADGVVDWGATPEEIAAVTSAACTGHVLLPASVARSLAPRGPRPAAPAWLTPQEVDWLRTLGRGTRIDELAGAAGYSERAMYRLLQGLYGRIGAANRTEAILLADRWGLLDPHGDAVDMGTEPDRS